MKTRMKRDLLQGMMNYPAPASGPQSMRIVDIRVKNRKFFQKIAPQAKSLARLRRGVTIIQPQISKPENRDATWRKLRKTKNI
jgi:hypothetical protein